MKYINADELKYKLKKYDDNDLIKVKYVRQYIDRAPSIEERKTDRWKYLYITDFAQKYRICPVCCTEEKDDGVNVWKYCPNCGSRLY